MPRRTSIWIRLAALASIVAAGGLAFIATRSQLFGGGPQDFEIFYLSASAWRHGGRVYNAALENMNPPAVTLLMAPLAWLSMETAADVWWAISFACLALAVWIMSRELPRSHAVLAGALIMISESGFSNIRLGQIAFPLLLAVTLAWAADRRWHPRAAGSWLGILIYAKPFLLPGAAYFLWRRSFQALKHALVMAAILAFIGFEAGGFQVYADWLSMLRHPPNADSALNASLYGFFLRTLQPGEHTSPVVALPWAAVLLLWGSASLAVLVVAARGISRHRRDRDRAWSLVLLGSILVSPLGWVHYLCIAAGPIVATVRGMRAWALTWAALFPLVLVRYIVLSTMTFDAATTATIASTYFWCTLLLFGAVLVSAPADVADALPEQARA